MMIAHVEVVHPVADGGNHFRVAMAKAVGTAIDVHIDQAATIHVVDVVTLPPVDDEIDAGALPFECLAGVPILHRSVNEFVLGFAHGIFLQSNSVNRIIPGLTPGLDCKEGSIDRRRARRFAILEIGLLLGSSCSLGRSAWHCYAKYCAASSSVFRPNPTTMSFDNRACNRQTDAHAIFLGRKERVEDPINDTWRNAGTSISNGNFDRHII